MAMQGKERLAHSAEKNRMSDVGPDGLLSFCLSDIRPLISDIWRETPPTSGIRFFRVAYACVIRKERRLDSTAAASVFERLPRILWTSRLSRVKSLSPTMQKTFKPAFSKCSSGVSPGHGGCRFRVQEAALRRSGFQVQGPDVQASPRLRPASRGQRSDVGPVGWVSLVLFRVETGSCLPVPPTDPYERD